MSIFFSFLYMSRPKKSPRYPPDDGPLTKTQLSQIRNSVSRPKKIPSSFKLGAYDIKVVRLSGDEIEKKCGNVYGLFDPGNLTIYLMNPDKTTKSAVLYQTFWHEYAHAMLWVADPKRYQNEKLVESLGHLLAQFHNTSEY